MPLAPYFRFYTGPVTFLVCISYLIIFTTTVTIHEYGWAAPEKGSGERMGLDLEGAMSDLRVIAQYPHPHNSAQNDIVHDYILSRTRSIAAGKAFVDVDDDTVSNVTFVVDETQNGNVVYFEGNNVLVKVEGERSDLPAVLLSAHFDSVPTAPGATDDGMGITSLLALLSHYAEHRPSRTLVFNFNNGEEYGLYGAKAFLPHPWASLPQTFINLEGTGQGGRPVLFRTSSPHVTSAYHRVPHPHGNSVSADAFKRGVIRSRTDYTVYETMGWEGLDVAFYKGRSWYHTMGDNVPALGGVKSQWAMLETAYYATEGLMADEESNHGGDTVFFDVLGSALAVFTRRTVYIINIFLLIFGPMVVGGLLWWNHGRRRTAFPFPLHGWVRFPVAFVVTCGGTIGLALVINRVNPYIVHSSSYVVLLSLLCTSFVLLAVTLRLFASIRPVHQQKVIVLIELYVFWWFLLAVATGLEGPPQFLVAPYFVTLFYSGTLFGLLLGLAEDTVLEWRGDKEKERIVRVPGQFEGDPEVEVSGNDLHDDALPDEPTERTPLVTRTQPEPVNPLQEGERQISGLWMFQFWLAVVFPAIWASQTVLLVMTSMGQTLVDGNPSIPAYLSIALLGILIILPLAPFVHPIHLNVTWALLLVLVGSTIWCLFAAPFTPTYPFKVFYQQEITLDVIPIKDQVMLGGLASIAPATVKEWKPEGEVTCEQDMEVKFRPNLRACTWEGHDGAKGMGVEYSITRTGPVSARVAITGSNSRVCGVLFNSPVRSVVIASAAPATSPLDSVNQILLHSRTWDRTFEIDFEFEQDLEGGSVWCEYADPRPGQIPDFDEVLQSIPVWATVTKGYSALVVAKKSWALPGL
ncbi:hypothetical protein DACRYDRAFT_118549 [Dacryopinax primogenitus]|uniref:Peptide hydrolase n=1 Tax=Dacryopinax primogenitus (strain DJM 731) TaxID=1858805 RepID=M5FYW6_DACPD|nr:uncharacterized protein DACRYDRAFT_118549 [Dacryopinax primogenitus]EJT98766.1 hypothetical protein DACRYDRAFT_118549 [Dacryopinax primogenitus]